jgi:hypothetical protein
MLQNKFKEDEKSDIEIEQEILKYMGHQNEILKKVTDFLKYEYYEETHYCYNNNGENPYFYINLPDLRPIRKGIYLTNTKKYLFACVKLEYYFLYEIEIVGRR